MEAPDPVSPITCTDSEAIEANEGHEPAGWPQSWSEGQELPDPECHPDFIELGSWEHYHDSCMHPQAHGTVVPGSMTEHDYRAAVWEASEIRSWWTPPAEGEDCYGHSG